MVNRSKIGFPVAFRSGKANAAFGGACRKVEQIPAVVEHPEGEIEKRTRFRMVAFGQERLGLKTIYHRVIEISAPFCPPRQGQKHLATLGFQIVGRVSFGPSKRGSGVSIAYLKRRPWGRHATLFKRAGSPFGKTPVAALYTVIKLSWEVG